MIERKKFEHDRDAYAESKTVPIKQYASTAKKSTPVDTTEERNDH